MSDFFKYVGSAHIRFDKALHLRPRQIDFHRFLFIESGRGEFAFPSHAFRIIRPTLLLLSPGWRETHYLAGAPVSYFYVEFTAPRKLIGTPYLECSPSSPHFRTLIGLLQSIEREKGIGVDQLLPAAVELALLQSEPHHPPAIDPRIQRVLNHIDRHLEQSLAVSQLASIACLSVPQFRRLFQKAVGLAPKAYFLRERMRYARKILQTEGLRVGEVAELLQFETVFQFSNQYKKVHGHSPAQDRSTSSQPPQSVI